MAIKYNHTLPDDSVNYPKESFVLQALKLLFSLVLLVVIFYAATTFVVNYAAEHISVETEKKLMKHLKMDVNMSEVVYVPKVQKIVSKLATCADLPYEVKAFVLDDYNVNAMAMPGGVMLITKGLLHKVQSQNALAMVIGHELGHFKHKDNLKSMGKGLVFGLLGIVLGENYVSLMPTTLMLANNRYSQTQEMAADLFGVDISICAYGTANGATTLFKDMTKDSQAWKYIVADHPDFPVRIKKMNAYIKEKHYDTTMPLTPIESLHDLMKKGVE